MQTAEMRATVLRQAKEAEEKLQELKEQLKEIEARAIKEKLLALAERLKAVEREKDKKINVFDAAGMTTQEIKHSAFFAWLADKSKPHGLGSLFLRKFCERLMDYESDGEEVLQNKDIIGDKFSRLNAFLSGEYTVVTEKVVTNKESRIDVFIESTAAQTVIVIENKVFTGTHDDQLNRYEDELNSHAEYKNYNKIYVYLTPHGDMPSDPSGNYDSDWCIFDYGSVCDIIKEIYNTLSKSKKDMRLKILLEDYMDLVSTNILNENKELRSLCRQIVREHKDALDILLSFTDIRKSVAQYAIDWLLNNYDGVIINWSSDNSFNFYTKTAKEYFERHGESIISEENKFARYVITFWQSEYLSTITHEFVKKHEESWSDCIKKFMERVAPNKRQGDRYFRFNKLVILSEEDRQKSFEEIKPKLDKNLKLFVAELKKIDEILLTL